MQNSSINPLEWVEKYSDDLYKYAFFCLDGDAGTAKDIVQETFLSALEKQHTFKGIASEKTWLFAILKNKITDHFRKKTQRKEISFSEEYPDDKPGLNYFYNPKKNGRWRKEHEPTEWKEQEIRMLEKEKMSVLMKCIALLPDKWKKIFVETFIGLKKGKEICKDFDISLSNYWVILHRSKVQVRECVEKKLK